MYHIVEPENYVNEDRLNHDYIGTAQVEHVHSSKYVGFLRLLAWHGIGNKIFRYFPFSSY